MIVTDLFGENLCTNIRILYVPHGDKVKDIASHIRLSKKKFSNIQVCLIAVGHHDLGTKVGAI